MSAPTSFADLDIAQALATFGALVQNILASSDLPVAEKPDLLEQLAGELQERLSPPSSTKEVGNDVTDFLARSIDDCLDRLQPLAGERCRKSIGAAEDEAERVTDALTNRVSGVIDRLGRRKPTAGVAMHLYSPRGNVARKDLGRLWQCLGLSGVQVARELRREGSKARGLSHMRLYQLLDSDSVHERERVLDAITNAALRRGRSMAEIKAVTKAVIGEKSAGATNPAQKYLDDLRG